MQFNMTACTLWTILVQENQNWAGWMIRYVIHPTVLIVVPLVCGLTTLWFIIEAWKREGHVLGIRALAGALLPFVALFGIAIFQPALFLDLAAGTGIAGLAISLSVGFGLPFLTKIQQNFGLPFGAFCFATILAVLVSSYAAVRDERLFIFYYGFAIGILLHLFFIGWPLDNQD